MSIKSFTDTLNKLSENHFVCFQSKCPQTRFHVINSIVLPNDCSDVRILWLCFDIPKHQFVKAIQLKSAEFYCEDYLPSKFDPAKQRDSLLKVFRYMSTSFDKKELRYRKIILIVDSFSSLMNEYDYNFICDCLFHLNSVKLKKSKTFLQTVLILDNQTSFRPITKLNSYLKYLCRIWVYIDSQKISTSLRKSSGKVVNEVHEYQISVKENIVNESETTKENAKNSDTVKCTFKLELTDREKEARAAVNLPYVRSSQNDTEFTQDGQIQYIPDEYDDWDEEDPDNDLELI